ncbi:Nucleotide-diphospho-sugar transferase family protein [Striga hermonthica]|uniref:Nucleotide-diphospho-sugar transferase family protein n=1 Tax=Striga hermonthica TaxID=68872 RepID=A0A9N7NZU5_STRHE|nr:Nucleotide-diphospho-sugar transferase family protein [Striga hermonthica]
MKTFPKNYSIFINPVTFISLFTATFFILFYCLWQPFLFGNRAKIEHDENKIVVKDELQIALEKASTAEGKTVIISVVNSAYAEPQEDVAPAMMDLFLEGFWAGEGTRPLVGRLLVVSVDRAAHERCQFRGLNCYRLAADDVDGSGGGLAGEKEFMSNGFVEMMWMRTRFLLDVLKRGFSFIFTDTDVLWLRDPFTSLSSNETIDLQISVDFVNRNSSLNRIPINTGFYFVRSNEKTVSLFQTWYDMRKNSTGMKEQDVLEKLMIDGFLEKHGLKTRFLDPTYFSGFCEDSRDVERVATVHANCCRSISAKVADLKAVLKTWKKFRSDKSTGNWNGNFQWPSHTSCIDSWNVTKMYNSARSE